MVPPDARSAFARYWLRFDYVLQPQWRNRFCLAIQRNETLAAAFVDCLVATVDRELAVRVAHVGAHRVDADGHLVGDLLALTVTGPITLVPVLVLRWLDRREPEPWFMVGLTLLWGGLIATGIASDINTYFDARIGLLSAVGTGPFVEEAAKGLGLLVFLLLLSDEFDGPRDGFIYGAMIGLGFNWLESSVYIVRGIAESGVVPWVFQLASRYVLLGLNGHALYTAITGTFIGFALLQRSILRRVDLVVLGFLLAALTHMSWNLVGTMLSGGVSAIIATMLYSPESQGTIDGVDVSALPLWLNWSATMLAVLIANGIGFLIVLLGLRRSNRWERRVMAEELQDEDRTAVMTESEYAQIEADCNPPKGNETARRIFVAQCNLAKRKFHLRQRHVSADDDPIVNVWRNELRELHGMSAV